MARGIFSLFGRKEPEPALQESVEEALPEIARSIAGQPIPTLPRKAAISLRLDADVLEWFRSHGPGYQTRINAVLRAYMEAAG